MAANSNLAQAAPLAILLDYAARAAGAPHVSSHTEDEGVSGMLVRLGERCGFVPVESVSEVIDVPRLTAVPGTVSWYLGLGSLRGRVLPVCDLGGYLFGQRNTHPATQRVLIHGTETESVGFVVDDLLGVHTVNEPPGATLSSTVSHQGQDVPVLQLGDIVTQSRFLRVSLDSA